MLPFLRHGITFVLDDLPDAFTFTNLSGKNASTQYTSNIVQVNGINAPITCTTNQGQLQVTSDAGGTTVVQAWASSVQISPGQYLQARLTTGGWATTTTATITAGPSYSFTWSVTTSTVTSTYTDFVGQGHYTYTVPAYTYLTEQMWGAGGGAGGIFRAVAQNSVFGGTGGTSQITNPSSSPLIASGGGGGGNGTLSDAPFDAPGGQGAAGGGANGDVNQSGTGNGGAPAPSYTDSGGNTFHGGAGGNGGYVQKTYTFGAPGSPAVGSTITIDIGAGGGPSSADWVGGSGGSDGQARISIG